MIENKWDVSRTEEGLQRVLHQIEECRASGDEVDLGNGLLALSYLVKWVRSDTDAAPFPRSHQLSLEALEVFRRGGHLNGQVRALVNASAMSGPFGSSDLLDEAESLANQSGDEGAIASVLAARARIVALTDPDKANELHLKVLEAYRKSGNRAGQARTLFSLAITDGSSANKRDRALEAAQIYRDLGDSEEASRCMSIAFMNAEELMPLSELEDMANQGLNDAQKTPSPSLEATWYTMLARVAVAKGQPDEANKFLRWAKQIDQADGLTDRERWENEVESLKSFINLAKAQGNRELAKGFQDQLKELRANKRKR